MSPVPLVSDIEAALTVQGKARQALGRSVALRECSTRYRIATALEDGAIRRHPSERNGRLANEYEVVEG